MYRRNDYGDRRDAVERTQMRNGEDEDYVLRRYPFDQETSRARMMVEYQRAIDYMFDVVKESRWNAVMGRLNRKLINRFKELDNKGIKR